MTMQKTEAGCQWVKWKVGGCSQDEEDMGCTQKTPLLKAGRLDKGKGKEKQRVEYGSTSKKGHVERSSSPSSSSVSSSTCTSSSQNSNSLPHGDDEEPGPSSSNTWIVSPSLTLENSGSVARDHLASERTWLAYVRTSLALSCAGVGLIGLLLSDSGPGGIVEVPPIDLLVPLRIGYGLGDVFELPGGPEDRSDDMGAMVKTKVKYLAAALVCLGIGVLSVGFVRYFAIQSSLVQGKFPVQSRVVVFVIVISQAALMGGVLSVVCLNPGEAIS
ncbi:hypothetical protein VKT23_006093 [Stygiomarasmius scandens]|uniref:DUF202 domain-containing protein n=1 Tax=Marasmiellus scandens TaxID=2682957 RepID=A0ABR1JRU6_9AGAR